MNAKQRRYIQRHWPTLNLDLLPAPIMSREDMIGLEAHFLSRYMMMPRWVTAPSVPESFDELITMINKCLEERKENW